MGYGFKPCRFHAETAPPSTGREGRLGWTWEQLYPAPLPAGAHGCPWARSPAGRFASSWSRVCEEVSRLLLRGEAGFVPPGPVIYLLPCGAGRACGESARRPRSRVARPGGRQLEALIGQRYIKVRRGGWLLAAPGVLQSGFCFRHRRCSGFPCRAAEGGDTPGPHIHA